MMMMLPGWPLPPIKKLEHISIGRKTNISNITNVHNLSRKGQGPDTRRRINYSFNLH